MRTFLTFKKYTLFLLLFLFVSIFAHNCGRDTLNPLASPESLPEIDLQGQKISCLVSISHIGAFQSLAEWFREETGAVVEVKFVNYPDLLTETTNNYSSESSPYDVILVWYPELGHLVEDNILLDLTDFIDQNQTIIQPDDYIPSLYDAYTLYDDKRWGLPFDGDTHVLFYRKSLLEKYNLSPPETWSEYQEIARIITEREMENGIYGTAIMASPSPVLIVSSFMNRLVNYNGRLLDENNNPVINSPEAVAALTAMVDEAAYALPSPLETDFSVSRDAFLSGHVAMVEQWTDIGIMAEDLNQSLIQGDWGVVPMPNRLGIDEKHVSSLNAGYSLGISNKALNPAAAKAFLLFASRPDITLRLNLINGGVDPTRDSVLKSEEFRTFAANIYEVEESALYNAVPWPSIPEMSQLLPILSDNIGKSLSGLKTPEQALQDTQTIWLEILQS